MERSGIRASEPHVAHLPEMELCIEKFRKARRKKQAHASSAGDCDDLAEPLRRFYSLVRVLKKIVARPRGARLAEHDDRRTADLEHRFLLAAPIGLGKRVHLDAAPHRQRANLHETEPTAVGRQCDFLGLSK
jgi:hypothetical protein